MIFDTPIANTSLSLYVERICSTVVNVPNKIAFSFLACHFRVIEILQNEACKTLSKRCTPIDTDSLVHVVKGADEPYNNYICRT